MHVCTTYSAMGLPGGSDGRVCLQCRRPGLSPWVGKIPWRKEWLPTPVFLCGGAPGQRSVAGCSSQGCKEPDATEGLTPSYRTASGCHFVIKHSNLSTLKHIAFVGKDHKQPRVAGGPAAPRAGGLHLPPVSHSRRGLQSPECLGPRNAEKGLGSFSTFPQPGLH